MRTRSGLTNKLGRLRQAILAKAFSGQLVPQDPNDEPAGALLELIRKQRAKNSKRRALLRTSEPA